jgi:hypothetical protein
MQFALVFYFFTSNLKSIIHRFQLSFYHTCMKYSISLFLALTFVPVTQSLTQTVDPLPNVSLPMGQIKKMGADFIKDITGKAVDMFANYLIDYSHASFQLERASWREGFSHRYAQIDNPILKSMVPTEDSNQDMHGDTNLFTCP